MRIGVDARPLRESTTSGISMYVRSLLMALAEIDKKNEYILYCHKPFTFPLPPKWKIRSGAILPFGSLWVQLELSRWLKQDRIELFWGTEHMLPLIAPAKCKMLLTICDLVHVFYPETMSPLNRLINRFFLPRSAEKADAIVTISNRTKMDVQEQLKPKTSLIQTVQLGVAPRFLKRNGSNNGVDSLLKLGVKKPYILSVGTYEPRKNLINAIRAFHLMADKFPHQLVLAGSKGWKNHPLEKELNNSPFRNRISQLGYVSDETLPDLYRNADLFVYPSWYEGFGLPPLEAMAAGVPVVCSNTSSLPEVVADAGLLADPGRPEEMAEKMTSLLNSPSLHESYLKERQEIPQINPQNLKFRLAISLWRHLPVLVTRLVGPAIAKHLP